LLKKLKTVIRLLNKSFLQFATKKCQSCEPHGPPGASAPGKKEEIIMNYRMNLAEAPEDERVCTGYEQIIEGGFSETQIEDLILLR